MLQTGNLTFTDLGLIYPEKKTVVKMITLQF